MIRHIPIIEVLDHPNSTENHYQTYCGRMLPRERCIDLQTDSIEDAECKSCQRSDDRRQIEYQRRAGEVICHGRIWGKDLTREQYEKEKRAKMEIHTKVLAEAINKEFAGISATMFPGLEPPTVSFDLNPEKSK